MKETEFVCISAYIFTQPLHYKVGYDTMPILKQGTDGLNSKISFS